MSHPAKQINKCSCQIINGNYDEAILNLTNTLKTLKLVLSGDVKILVPREMEDEIDDNFEDDEDDAVHDEEDDCMGRQQSGLSSSSRSSSSSKIFEYDFFSSPTSSSFLKTVVSVRGPLRTQTSRIRTHPDEVSPSCISRTSSSMSSNSSIDVSIFRDPIMVRGDHFQTPLDIQVCEELAYVAIYNLALSHHLKSVELEAIDGASNQNLRRIYLHKALSLYEHSHQILMKQTVNVGVPVIHSMALVSNLSQIHHSLGDHIKAEMCMQYLLSTMMYVIDCGKVDTLGNSMDGFFNLILPLISGDVPAPAA